MEKETEGFRLPSVGFIGGRRVDRQVMLAAERRALALKRAVRVKRVKGCEVPDGQLRLPGM